MEMCECVRDLVDHHNMHVEMMYELIEALLDTYTNVEQTKVNDVMCETMETLIVESANICTIANCYDEEHDWFVDEDFFILRDDEIEEECECCAGPKMSDFLS